MSGPDDLAAEWRAAVRRPEVASALAAAYQVIADQVALHAPVCVSSGRCCNFRDYGHRLYTTGLEAAFAFDAMPTTPEALAGAVQRGDCPYLVGTMCGAHGIKPSGCRIFFCDQESDGWQQALSERVVAMIRRLHESHGITYRYAEWRELLGMFVDGRPHSGQTGSVPTS